MIHVVEFQTSSDTKEKLSGLKVGHILFTGVNVEKSNSAVDALVQEASAEVSRKFPNPESILEDPVVKGFRTLFSKLGTDPTKERPSGEALIRRVSSGKGIYRINTVVDVNNVVSMLTACPCGSYDADRLQGNITLVIGKQGESYTGFGNKEINAENKLFTRDELSIFGGLTADSQRTSITTNTKKVLTLIYLPPEAPEETLQKAVKIAKEKMVDITGCKIDGSGIYSV